MNMFDFFDSLPSHLPRPSSFPSPSKVRPKARQLSGKLFKDKEELHAIVERHEGTIRKRWSKRSNQHKQKFLPTSWPDMSPKHRPDMESWKKNTKFKEAFMWPYMNIEDHKKTREFLVLLNARNRHEPHEFVLSGLKQAALGETAGVNAPAFLDEYTMYLNGRSGPQSHGELVSWDDDENAFDDMYNGVGMHPGHGLQALVIQERVWDFLVKSCRLLLQEVSQETLFTGPIQPEPEALKSQEKEILSLDVAAMEAPYLVPAQLDIARPKGIVYAQTSSREDHIWAMREDPSYFVHELQDHADHRQENLLDSLGHKHP